jgi:transposase
MIRVEMAQWGQTLDDLRAASLQATHWRSRERFQALYLIAAGLYNATTCAAHLGRQDETVLAWIHRYNQHGPNALLYRHTGGRAPLLTPNRPNRSPTSSKRRAPTNRACPVTTGR